ncbi:alpha/beta-hydrolase [Tilletiaria anomala UBC 951]|uniref:Alpha/beta-hydrolase n=1 Tax=Tilletiaria anomala (strain ATCC 24038 / CBS 436.72 / UBC 951) TaxID=1037660 RepID=A0A066WSE1_TILAU|nr:alpha/beta-hydrolase [Tilletiaria anomala UBC 951]KDN53605.1 alpha/beta-hydrolase [Tilletiaria anomala UBC 951]
MASESKLSELDLLAVAAARNARIPRRHFWLPLLRLILQHAFTTPVVLTTAPFIILKNIFPFLRRHPLWSFKVGVFTELVRIAIICMGLIRFSPIPNKENGWRETSRLAPLLQAISFSSAGVSIMADNKTQQRLKIKAKRLDRVWFNPPPPEMLRGILSVNVPNKVDQVVSSPRYVGRPLIQPYWAKARCRAFWYMRSPGIMPPNPGDNEKRKRPVLLYIHGGAGVSFAAGDMFMGDTLAKNLARTANVDILSVDYDLAPYARYPTTVLQTLGAWLYLTRDLGYDSSQVYVGGDSYGGFTTVLFNRWMRDVWSHLPAELTKGQSGKQPGLLLLSPWVTIENEDFASRAVNLKYDIITAAYSNWGTDCLGIGPQYIKSLPISTKDAWLSPVHMEPDEFAELPPLFVHAGGAETLLDEGRMFLDKARQAGVDAEWLVSPGMHHDMGTNPALIPESKVVWRRVKLWLADLEDKKSAKA